MISDLQLQKGSPIDIGICKVYPLTLGEITDVVGEVQYNQLLSAMLIDKSSLDLDGLSQEDKQIFDKTTNYEIMIINSHKDEEMRRVFENAFSLFIREDVHYNPQGFFHIGELSDNRVISNVELELIRQVLKKQNYLQDDEDDFKPANDKARELYEKIKKAKEKIKKKNTNDGLRLSDIVSIVATYSNDINILTVWNLTIYQLYESYLRLIMWDNYHTNMLHIHRLDEEARKSLQHWANKVKTK